MGCTFTAEQVAEALDPVHFVNIRSGLGGVAPQATAALLDLLESRQHEDDSWLRHAQKRLEQADQLRGQSATHLRQ